MTKRSTQQHPVSHYAPTTLRISLAILYGALGIQKWLAPGVTGSYLAQLGLPAPQALGWLITVIEPLGALLLLLGIRVRIVASVLAVIPLAGILAIDLPNFSVGAAQIDLFKNIAIIGSCAALAMLGPGHWRVRLSRKK